MYNIKQSKWINSSNTKKNNYFFVYSFIAYTKYYLLFKYKIEKFL